MRRELLTYLASGILSMAAAWAAMFGVNFLCFGGSLYPGPVENMVLGVVNWTAGMLSAYAMNRKWVFRSAEPMGREFPKFAASRVFTFGVDQILRQVLGMLGVDLYIMSAILAVIVTVLNYAMSKTAVFRSGGNHGKR